MKNIPFNSKPFGKVAKGNLVDQEISYKSAEPEIESDSEDEMNYIHKEFQAIKDKEIDQFNRVTDANFYFCVYFADTEQKDQFIELIQASGLFDATNRFVSGQDLAKKLNIPLPEKKIKRPGYFNKGKRFNFNDFI